MANDICNTLAENFGWLLLVTAIIAGVKWQHNRGRAVATTE